MSRDSLRKQLEGGRNADSFRVFFPAHADSDGKLHSTTNRGYRHRRSDRLEMLLLPAFRAFHGTETQRMRDSMRQARHSAGHSRRENRDRLFRLEGTRK